jgi:hypothetical protein
MRVPDVAWSLENADMAEHHVPYLLGREQKQIPFQHCTFSSSQLVIPIQGDN